MHRIEKLQRAAEDPALARHVLLAGRPLGKIKMKQRAIVRINSLLNFNATVR